MTFCHILHFCIKKEAIDLKRGSFKTAFFVYFQLIILVRLFVLAIDVKKFFLEIENMIPDFIKFS